MKNINIENTIKIFGYNPNELKPSSEKLVVWFCSNCMVEKNKKFRYAKKNSLCLGCSNKINANTNINIRSKKLIEWHKNNEHPLLNTKRPDYVIDALKKSATGRIVSEDRKLQLSKKHSGVGNPMYGKKHSEASLLKMKQFQKNNFSIRGKNSNFYGKIHHGKGDWYICKDGSKVWMRSSWEIGFAKYLDENNVMWIYEAKSFPITYNGKEGTYTPDFYIIKQNVYFEIKGWWRDDAYIKYTSFKSQYPNIEINIIDKNELLKLGILKK